MIVKGVWSAQNNQWVGLSTDPNPTDAQGAKLNDLLYWTDTGARFVYCGDVAGWIAVIPGTNSIGGGGSSVTVTNFPATQPVSIAATVPVSLFGNVTVVQPTAANLNATVTGTVAVSGTVPVSGTFFQATQPVSIAGTVATTLSGTPAVSISGTPAVTVTSGTVIATQATAANLNVTAVVASGTVTAVTTVGSITNAVSVTPPTLTKGTQGATGESVQELKDAGRNQTNYFMAGQVVSTATETLQSLTGYKGGAAVTATTTPAVVTSGKTYRIEMIVISYIAVGTTAGAIQVNLRANLSGVALVTSPLVDSWIVGSNSVSAGDIETIVLDYPDGREFPAGTGLGVTVLGLTPTGGALAEGYAKISVSGFEY